MRNNKVKCLHIISCLDTGGAENALLNLLSGGLAEKYNCHVISLRDEGTIGPQITKLGIPVSTLDLRNNQIPIHGLFALRKIVMEFQPDIIQGWMYLGNLAALLAKQSSTRKTIVLWNIRHSLHDIGYEKMMTRWNIRFSRLISKVPDIILYNSHVSCFQHEEFGFHSNNSMVIPNGIDTNKFNFSAFARQQIRLQLNIPKKGRVVGHVARFHPMKDHRLFISVAVDLANNYPDVHFVLSGRKVTIENSLFKQMIPESLLNRFHLLGERSDVDDLMSAFDIFCLSSAWGEGFPNVLGEALSSELTCIATDIGDCEVVLGGNGLVIPCKHEIALHDGLDKLLNLSLKERQVIGKSSREHILKNYMINKIVEKYSSLYDSLSR